VLRSKYDHWPSGAASSSGSQLGILVSFTVIFWLETTYTLLLTISSTRLCSPSATWMTSSIKPAPSLLSRSEILCLSVQRYKPGS
jgi:hypothetical protein